MVLKQTTTNLTIIQILGASHKELILHSSRWFTFATFVSVKLDSNLLTKFFSLENSYAHTNNSHCQTFQPRPSEKRRSWTQSPLVEVEVALWLLPGKKLRISYKMHSPEPINSNLISQNARDNSCSTLSSLGYH